MFSVKDKVVVVTGGGSGLGLATVKMFLEGGAKVVMGDYRDCADLAEELGCDFVQADVSVEKDVENLMKTAASRSCSVFCQQTTRFLSKLQPVLRYSRPMF